MRVLQDRRVASVLAEARQAHVAVETSKGPHVTPQLYTSDGDDVWFFAAASTVKAKALRRRPRAGVLVRAGTRSVALIGDVARYDAGDPGALASGATGLPNAARAMAGYAVRNAPDLLGFARDAITGRVGRALPARRVLFRLRPTAGALLEDDGVVATWGEWPGGSNGTDAVEPAEGVPAVAAWLSDAGPLAAPVRWDESAACATLPSSLLDLAPVTRAEASVVIDDYGGSGPAPKRGALLRGSGRVRRDGGRAVIALDTDTLTTWDGAETETVRA